LAIQGLRQFNDAVFQPEGTEFYLDSHMTDRAVFEMANCRFAAILFSAALGHYSEAPMPGMSTRFQIRIRGDAE
jgi:hypothetical protein